jgi:hypothetical protein
MGTKRKRGVNPDGATILPDQPDALPSSNFHDARMAGNGPGNLCEITVAAKQLTRCQNRIVGDRPASCTTHNCRQWTWGFTLAFRGSVGSVVSIAGAGVAAGSERRGRASHWPKARLPRAGYPVRSPYSRRPGYVAYLSVRAL